MLSNIIIATLIIGWIGLFIFFIDASFTRDGRFIIGAAVLAVIALAIIIDIAKQENNQGPCIEKKTAYQYNSATKTMMPYTYCVDRGKWVKP